jgi:hypothetical protein
MQQLLDKWERLRKSEYLRPDEKLMLNHCISDLKRFMNHSGEANEMVGKRTAVDWLCSFMLKPLSQWPDDMWEQAKEMEREQMIDFARKYMLYIHKEGIITIETFYNETYGGNK